MIACVFYVVARLDGGADRGAVQRDAVALGAVVHHRARCLGCDGEERTSGQRRQRQRQRERDSRQRHSARGAAAATAELRTRSPSTQQPRSLQREQLGERTKPAHQVRIMQRPGGPARARGAAHAPLKGSFFKGAWAAAAVLAAVH